MKNVDFDDYKRKYKEIRNVSDHECYCGGKNCSSCMHCFPGRYAVYVENYDFHDVCMMAKKSQ